MKEKLFQVFFCIYIFWQIILQTYHGLRGMELGGSQMRLTLMVVAGISWLFYLSFPKKRIEELKMIMLLGLFGLCYYSTQFFYSDFQFYDGYIGQFLRWGADSVSACVIGMTLLKLKNYDLIHSILPWECLALTPFMAIASFTMGVQEAQMHVEGGMNYQTIAYSMAVLFCLSFFYTFIYNKSSSRIIKTIFLMTMLIQSVSCAMSGGRGGLVLLVVYIVYMSYFIVKNKIFSLPKLLFVGSVLFSLFFVFASYFGLWNSAGFERSSSSLESDDRFGLWKEYLPYIENNWLFGNGLGSDYFTWGFYSHNIFLDLLVETGIVGLILLLFFLWKTYNRIFALTKSDDIFVVVMILFIYGIVMNMFSGYWISQSTNWMAFGVAMTMSNFYKWQKKIKV